MSELKSGQPLSADDVKLLVKGDLLRVIEAGSFLLGRGLVDGGVATVRSVDGPYVDVYGPAERSDNRASRFAFIGRPDADGWMPTPSKRPEGFDLVDCLMADGSTLLGQRCFLPETWLDPDFTHWRPARLAPTAPVEASGSEREHGPKCWGGTSFSDEMAHCYCGSTDLRPQPSGETRGVPIWIKPMVAALEGYEADWGGPLDNMHELGRIDDSRSSPSFRIRVGHVRALARLCASPAPVALGGQHSTPTDFPPDDVLACVEDTTPARAEAQDEGAADALRFYALGQQDNGHRAKEALARAHPSPPPAADEDRVLLEQWVEAFDGLGSGSGPLINATRARLAALKSTAAKDGGEG